MKLLICVLNETEKLNQLMSAMSEFGISDATVFESQGMGRILSEQTPVFAGFRHLLAGDRSFNYTIFAVVEDDELLERTLEAMREHLLPNHPEGTHGIVFAVPVSGFVKFNEESYEHH